MSADFAEARNEIGKITEGLVALQKDQKGNEAPVSFVSCQVT